MSTPISRRSVPAKAALNQVRQLVRWAIEERKRKDEAPRGSAQWESAHGQQCAFLLAAFLVATPFRTP